MTGWNEEMRLVLQDKIAEVTQKGMATIYARQAETIAAALEEIERRGQPYSAEVDKSARHLDRLERAEQRIKELEEAAREMVRSAREDQVEGWQNALLTLEAVLVGGPLL